MSLRLYHQLGHVAKWNIDSFEIDHTGDGLILSPVHQTPANIAVLKEKTRTASYFDPQFYVPSSQKSKLQQYEFFPDLVADGFETSTFEAHSRLVAERCVAFQLAMGFRRPVIPTRFIDQMYSNYIDRQRAFSVEAFVEALDGREAVLSLAVTAPMLMDEDFRTKLLNWITGYPNITELHLAYSTSRETKQVNDADLLLACVALGREVLGIGLNLVWTHVNSEAFLFTMQGDVGVTIGSFENTRMFSIEKFLSTDEERRGPKARLFLPGLLNWVQFDQAKEIRKRLPSLWTRIHQSTPYAEEAFQMAVEPAFNQPQLYKHYFLVADSMMKNLRPMSVAARVDWLAETTKSALSNYQEISRAGIELERHGRGGHLVAWKEVIASALR